MSGPDDTFLARWSRRKQAVKEADAAVQEQSAEQAGRTGEAPRAAKTVAEEESAAAEHVETLPNIEELTAESDISAFLRKGVPDALRKAALRKAWSLDPTIRDFVGPAEYAWDFNNPASIPGFGAAPAGAALAKLAVLGATPSLDAGERTPAPEPSRESVRPSAPAEDVPNSPPTASDATDPPDVAGRIEDNAAQLPDEANGAEELRDGTARPRHGGALPR